MTLVSSWLSEQRFQPSNTNLQAKDPIFLRYPTNIYWFCFRALSFTRSSLRGWYFHLDRQLESQQMFNNTFFGRKHVIKCGPIHPFNPEKIHGSHTQKIGQQHGRRATARCAQRSWIVGWANHDLKHHQSRSNRAGQKTKIRSG